MPFMMVPENCQVFAASDDGLKDAAVKLPVNVTPFEYVKVIFPPEPNVAPVNMFPELIAAVVRLKLPKLAGEDTDSLGIP